MSCVRAQAAETSLAYLDRAANVGGGNCASAVCIKVNSGDIIPAWGTAGRGVERGFERSVFRSSHPQRLSLKGSGWYVRESRSGRTHRSGGVRTLDRGEEGRDVGVPQMLPERDHIARVLDQEQNSSGVPGTAEDSIDSGEGRGHLGRLLRKTVEGQGFTRRETRPDPF
jgi:hypothetical protein